jgi:hypothetical protein
MFDGGFLGMVPVVGLGQISPPPQGFYKLVELHDAAQASGDVELERYYEHLIEEHLEKQRASWRQRQRAVQSSTSRARRFDRSRLTVPISSEAQRRATAYQAPRIPTLPFGGSFWGGGATTTYS